MITYQVEQFEEVKHQIVEMAREHWREVEYYQDEIPLDIDLDKYQLMNDAGMIKIITVRNQSQLVGYIAMLIHLHPHHKNTLYAMNDMFYILPEFRKGRTGIEIFKFTEEVMRAEGVKIMLLSCKAHLDKGTIFKRLGFIPAEISYSKLL
jgi:GNAT superfamily N-acetyltransferase